MLIRVKLRANANILIIRKYYYILSANFPFQVQNETEPKLRITELRRLNFNIHLASIS